MTLGIVVLQGPGSEVFLMSEVPLYGARRAWISGRNVTNFRLPNFRPPYPVHLSPYPTNQPPYQKRRQHVYRFRVATPTVSPKPEIRILRPAIRDPRAEARDPKPGTRNSRPETRDPRPASRIPNPETRNPKPETRKQIEGDHVDFVTKETHTHLNFKIEWKSANPSAGSHMWLAGAHPP
jgi:hypothetical protein